MSLASDYFCVLGLELCVLNFTSAEYAKCNSCRIDISVAIGEKNDITKHVTSENHNKKHCSRKKRSKDNQLCDKGPKESDKLVYSETKFAMFLVKNNLPFSICDEFSTIVSDMFPESELAKKYGAEKTKNSQIIKGRRRGTLKKSKL